MSKFHQTKGYRYWRKRVYLRGKRVCAVSGVKKQLTTHHLWSAFAYPKYKLHVKRGVLISKKIHSIFHIHWMGGYQVKCTKQDFDDFLIGFKANKKLFINSELI